MANAYQTNYFDPMGTAKKGYIINGKTYKDADGKERVEKGSVVETADGYYTLTGSGGVKSDLNQTAMENTKNQIESMKNESRQQNELLYNAKKSMLDNQKREIRNYYNKQAKEEYLRSMEAQKNINQILKAQGISGGMSESRLLQNQLAHENAVNELKEKRDDSIMDIDAQLLALRNETDYNIASQNTEYDKLYLDYTDKNLDRISAELQNERRINADNYNNLLNYERDVFESDRDYNWTVEESNRDYNRRVEEFEAELLQRQLEEQNKNTRFYDELAQEQAQYEKSYLLDERKLNHDIANDNRNYSLNVQKSNRSAAMQYNNEQYERDLEEAEILAEYGNLSGYANLYGWDDSTIKQAEAFFKKKNYN